jgi:hypothetical protein
MTDLLCQNNLLFRYYLSFLKAELRRVFAENSELIIVSIFIVHASLPLRIHFLSTTTI